MDFDSILERMVKLMNKAESLANKLDKNYPLIPSNIVAIKKVEMLETETKQLKQTVEDLSAKNECLLGSIARVISELDSITLPMKKSTRSEEKLSIDEINRDQLGKTNNSSFGVFNSKLTSQDHYLDKKE